MNIITPVFLDIFADMIEKLLHKTCFTCFSQIIKEKKKKKYQFMSGVSEWENIANQNEVREIINQIKIITSYLRQNS